jgi:hypothetical protein
MDKRTLFIAGLILLVLGAAALIVPAVSVTTKEKVVDLGPIDISADKRARRFPRSSFVAGLGGIAPLITSARKT